MTDISPALHASYEAQFGRGYDLEKVEAVLPIRDEPWTELDEEGEPARPHDINNFRQNHPELVVHDLAHLVPPDVMRHVLKCRGINKWLRVRRLLIQLKSRWKDDLNRLRVEREDARAAHDTRKFHRIGGYMEAVADCRQQVRALCHSPREVDFPDNAGDFGAVCELPQNFPKRPHKRWFWRYDGIKPVEEVRNQTVHPVLRQIVNGIGGNHVEPQ